MQPPMRPLQVVVSSGLDGGDDRVPVGPGSARHGDEVVDAEHAGHPAGGSSALVRLNISGSVTSRVNFVASGLGVVLGVAVAIS